MSFSPGDRWLEARRKLTPEEAGRRLRAARRILLVKPHHKLGDLLVSTPLIRNLRRALPEAELVFLAGRYNAPAVLDNPDLNEVVVGRLKGPGALTRTPFLLHDLRSRRFDAALMLSTISHSGTAVALARLARPEFLAGLDDAPYGSAYARRSYDCVLAPPEDLKVHIVDYNLTLLERLGVPITTREHVLGVTADQVRLAEDRLRDAKLDLDAPILGVQVGGNHRGDPRRWPLSHYAAVVQRARAEAGFQVVLLGGETEREATDAVRGLGHRELPALIGLPFPVYKGVLKRLDFFLTHDGGPVHVAAGVGVPSFFIFLSTPPWRWAPYGSRFHIWEEYTRPPGPGEVWERLEPLLETARATGRGNSREPGA